MKMKLRSYEMKLVMLLLAIVIIGGGLYGSEFLTVTTLKVIANQIPELGMISLAIMVVMTSSGLNVSVVSITALAGIVGGIVIERSSAGTLLSTLISIVVVLLIGLVAGIINGIVVGYLEVPAILATLGTMLLYRGLALNLSGGGSVSGFGSIFIRMGMDDLLGIPIPLVIFLVTVGILYYLTAKTNFGNQLYQIGKNKIAAMYSGIPINSHVMKVFVVSGLVSSVAAIIMAARYNSMRADYGSSYLINGIVAVSLGGVEIKGGKGTVIGLLLSLLIIGVFTRLMFIADVNAFLIDATMGFVLLVNVLIQRITARGER